MADLRQREAVLERDGRRQQPQSRVVASKTQAKAARKAFMNCWEDVKGFFVDINDGLYTKSIISEDTFLKVRDQHDRDALLPAIERRLRLANSCAEFNTILDLLEAKCHLQIVADKLREEYQMVLSGRTEAEPKDDIATCTLAIIVALMFALLLAAVVYIAILPVNYSTRILREAYEPSPILGPEHNQTAPYIEPTFYQVPKPNQVASLHPISLKGVLTVTDGDRILIRGDPGTGKTMLTHAITQKWKEGEILTHCDLFAYRLRWFIDSDDTLVDILKYYIMSHDQYKKKEEEIYRYNGRNICFLLDGLDEYESGYNDVKSFFYLLLRRKKLQKATVIVTSRNIILPPLDWTREYRISLFSDEQRREYFKQSGKNLEKVLSRHEHLWKMCYNPLYASLLIEAFDILDLNITTETELFEKITLRTYERELKIQSGTGIIEEIKDLKHLLDTFPIVVTLCSLALNGSLTKKYSFDYSDVPDELRSTNLSYLVVEPKHPGSTKLNSKTYTFSHPSLMHFLAAVNLTYSTLEGGEQAGLDQILERANLSNINNETGVEEVWKFVCGLTRSFQLQFGKVLSRMWGTSLRKTLFHCAYEASSHQKQTQVQSAAHDLIANHGGRVYFGYRTLTTSDMQAIGFVASTAPDELRSIGLTHVKIDEDNWLSSLFFSLTMSETTFTNFEKLEFVQIRSKINFDESTKKHLKEFFAHTPKFSSLKLKNVPKSLVLMALYAPLHCKTIDLSHTRLDTTSGVTPFLLIEHRLNMTRLDLSDCDLKDWNFQDMKISSCKHNQCGLPRELVLKNNDIGDEGAVALASYIRRRFEASPSLHCDLMWLELQHNHIGGRGLAALLAAVQVCPNLLFFNMSYNKPVTKVQMGIQQHFRDMTLSSFPEEFILESSDIDDAIVGGLLSACSDSEHCSESEASSNCRLKKLILKSNHVTSIGFVALFKAAHTCCHNLTFIDLTNNILEGSIQQKGPGKMSDFYFLTLEHGTGELVMFVDNSNIDDEGAVDLIMEIDNTATKSHCRLTGLDLHFNHISRDRLMHLYITAHTHCADLTLIDLSYNGLDCQQKSDYRSGYGLSGNLTLYLSHSDIKDQEAADFAEHIKTYCNLKGLDMSFNQISSLQLVNIFKAAHTFCPILTIMDLSYNREMGCAEMKVKARHHQKRRLMLYMDHSDIDDKAAVALTDYIRSTAQSSTPCSLSVVDLSSNHISSSHLMGILKALYTFCPNLTMVDLSNNRATDDVDQQWGRKQHHYQQSGVLKIYMDNSNIDSEEVVNFILSSAKSSGHCRNKKLYLCFDDISYEGLSSLLHATEVCSDITIVAYTTSADSKLHGFKSIPDIFIISAQLRLPLHFILEQNHIGDVGAIALAEHIQRRISEVADLCRNITDIHTWYFCNCSLIPLSLSSTSSEDQSVTELAVATCSYMLADSDQPEQNLLKIFNEMALRKSLQDLNLILSYSDISDEGAIAIAEYIRRAGKKSNCRLETLHLDHNNIGAVGLVALLNAAEMCPNLKHINLSHNAIMDGDEEGRKISDILSELVLVEPPKMLDLAHNDIGDEGAVALARSIRKGSVIHHLHYDTNPHTRRTLRFQFNSISGRGLVALLGVIHTYPYVIVINLTGNSVTDSDVDSIIKACNVPLHHPVVSVNPNIQHEVYIKLTDNKLTDDGEAKLKKNVIRRCIISIYRQP